MDYHRIDEYPEKMNAVAVVVRLLDGLGFRFYWATYELDEDDYGFTPVEGGNSTGWMVSHIWGLMNWIYLNIKGEQKKQPPLKADQRNHVLDLIRMIRQNITRMSDEQLAEVRIEGAVVHETAEQVLQFAEVAQGCLLRNRVAMSGAGAALI